MGFHQAKVEAEVLEDKDGQLYFYRLNEGRFFPLKLSVHPRLKKTLLRGPR